MKTPLIWAHRGASGYETDNTMEAFKLAIEMGADGLESDVHITKDNHLIFFHDDTVEYQGKQISPSSLTLEQLRSITLKNNRNIPTVAEVFEYFKQKTTIQGEPIRYSLDLKTLDMGYPLVELAEKIGIAKKVELTPNDNYPSFWKYVERYRKLSANIQIVDSAHFEMEPFKRLFRKMYYQNWDKFHKFRLKGVNLKAARATDSAIKQIRDNNLKVYVWDCHTPEKIEAFCRKRVDSIYSNYPDLAVKIRNQIVQS